MAATDRRVLMFAHSFPPCTCYPTASERPYGFARYLPEWGWEPTVVTRDIRRDGCRCRPAGEDRAGTEDEYAPRLRGGRLVRIRVSPSPVSRLHSVTNKASRSQVIAVPALGLRKLATLGLLLSEVRDNWVKRAVVEGRGLLEKRQADVVWTTSRPFRSTSVGLFFQEKYNLPWVADLRDSISRIPSRDVKWAARRVSNRRFFPALRKAAAVVGVSPEEADRDAQALGRSVDVIPSGFDSEEWRGIRTAALRQNGDTQRTRRILYAGRIYPHLHDPDIFFRGLRLFIDQARELGPVVSVNYLGPDGEQFRTAAKKANVAEVITDEGTVTATQARRRMVEADLLLLLTDAEGRSGIPGGKIYEYLAAGTPIIAVPGRDEYVKGIFRQTDAGVGAASPADVATALEQLLKGTKELSPLDQLAEYTWKERARALAQVLDRSAGVPAG